MMRMLNSFKSKPATGIGLVIGVILIVLFPLGLASYLASFETISSPFVNSRTCYVFELIIHDHEDNCSSRANIVEMLKSHRWWEAVAFFWTLIFTGLFLWWDLPEAYDELNKVGSGKWSSRLSIIVTVVMIVSFSFYFWGDRVFDTQAYTAGLAAKVMLALTFVLINSMIVKRARELLANKSAADLNEKKKLHKLEQIVAEFTALNRDIDRPTFLTLLVLLIWDLLLADGTIVDLEAFIAGASSVILITTAFSFGFTILGDDTKKIEAS